MTHEECNKTNVWGGLRTHNYVQVFAFLIYFMDNCGLIRMDSACVPIKQQFFLALGMFFSLFSL